MHEAFLSGITQRWADTAWTAELPMLSPYSLLSGILTNSFIDELTTTSKQDEYVVTVRLGLHSM